MFLLTALLQAAALVQPLYLADDPPELRAVRSLRLQHRGALGCPAEVVRTREETIDLAKDIVLRLRAGADFERVADEYALRADRPDATLLGTYTPQVLAPEFDRFLFSSEVGALSDPIATDAGVHVLERVETWAGAAQILVRGTDAASRERCARLVDALRAGADFAALARESSDDPESRARGGPFALYERGRRDTLLKREIFSMDLGEIRGPIESPLGFHILRRVPIDAVDRELSESNFVRVRAILIAYDTAIGADPATAPTQPEAKAIADGIRARIEQGADMRELARERTDEPGGKERDGDLGWLHRYSPNVPDLLRRVFFMRRGETSEPISTTRGFLVLRRER